MKFNKNHISKIKLIIWDLDETFWKGTLSDININAPSIIPIDSNISLVKKLSKRGIVNSVCSKNDCELAENELRRLDVLEYFVFNSINWESKGGRIKQMIKDMALRPENVLFILNSATLL
jgi:FkbH-like protein